MRIFSYIVKTDEFHVKRRSAQRLYNSGIGIVLFVINRVMHHMISPCAHFTPAVEYSYFFNTVWRCAFDILIKSAEFIADALYVINKFRELHCQLQITAVPDPVDRLAQDCSSCSHPVIFCFFYRIAALMERIREEIRQQPALCIFYSLDIADQS